MASGVSEVDAATTVVGVDLARPLAAWVTVMPFSSSVLVISIGTLTSNRSARAASTAAKLA